MGKILCSRTQFLLKYISQCVFVKMPHPQEEFLQNELVQIYLCPRLIDRHHRE